MAMMWTGGEETKPRPDESARRRIAELEGKLRAMEEQTALQRSTMERQLSEHRGRVEQLQSSLDLTRLETKEWRERCATAEAAETEAKRKHVAEEREVQRLKVRCDEIDTSRRELEAQVEEMRAYQDRARDLGSKCRSLEELLGMERHRREEAERKKEETHTALIAKEALLVEEHSSRAAAEGRNADLLGELHRKEHAGAERASHLQSLLDIKQRELESCQKAQADAEESAGRRVKALGEESMRETRKLRDRCNALEQRVMSFNEASKSVEETEREHGLADQRARDSLRALAVEQANRQTLEAHVRLLEAKLKDAGEEKERQEKAAKRLAEELEEARLLALTRQRAALTERGRSNEELAADLAEEKRAHARLRAAHADLAARVPLSPSLALTRNTRQPPPPSRTPLISGPSPTVVPHVMPRTPAPQIEQWEVNLNSSVWEHPPTDSMVIVHESKTNSSQPATEGGAEARQNWAKAKHATAVSRKKSVSLYPFDDDEDPLLL
eukprot:Hpha_TRINITY_DN784_c0_g1::TRINITY_DN784_c0_g1_i1::g.28888::m.28888